MKQILLFIAAVVISTGINAQLQQWTIATSSVTLEQETSIKTEGDNAVKATWTSTSNQDIESEVFSVTSDAPFSYKLDVLDNDAGGRIRMVIVWSTGNDYTSIYSTDDANWTTLEYTGNVPTGATTAQIRLRFYDVSAGWDGDAVIYVDNAIFSENEGANLIPDGGFESWPSADAVVTPEFSPAGGVYNTAQNITLSSTTEGATIYYTTDGSTPDNTSTEYSDAFEVSSNTTIMAIAYKDGMQESVVSEATYLFPVEVSTIAELRSQAEDGVYLLTGEAFLTYQQSYRGAKYLQDATGGIAIDDTEGIITTSYNVGDGISGIVGTLGNYNQLLQIVPAADPGAATSTNNDISAVELTVAQLEASWSTYESTLVKINGINFGEEAGNTFSQGSNYDVTDAASSPIVLRLNFYTDFTDEIIPATADVTGLAIRYNTTYQLAPRYISDIASTTTSIASSDATLEIYPVPFTTQLTVNADAISYVEILNAVGQLVSSNIYSGTNQAIISTSDLSNGVYIVKVKTLAGDIITQKVIKK